jgi:hypothetical protein
LGEFFAYLAVVYFGILYENYKNSANDWATFSHCTTYVLIWTKKGWPKFWAILSQSHLITLSQGHGCQIFLGKKYQNGEKYIK